MRRATIFVLSDVRSGSTLLDQCLGAHSDVVSLGELHWLRAYVLQDRSIYDPAHPLVCSCGATVPECDFWRSVAAEVGRPLESLEVALPFRAASLRVLQGIPAKLDELAKRVVRASPAGISVEPGAAGVLSATSGAGQRRSVRCSLSRDAQALLRGLLEVAVPLSGRV